MDVCTYICTYRMYIHMYIRICGHLYSTSVNLSQVLQTWFPNRSSSHQNTLPKMEEWKRNVWEILKCLSIKNQRINRSPWSKICYIIYMPGTRILSETRSHCSMSAYALKCRIIQPSTETWCMLYTGSSITCIFIYLFI